MQRITSYSELRRIVLKAAARGFSSSTGCLDEIVASVLLERLPVVIPKLDPAVYAFQEFSFRWRQQYSKEYPEAFLRRSEARGKGDYQIDFAPAPRITEADKNNDKRSLKRAPDRRLYLLLYGPVHGSNGNPVWHFPEKVYESEQTLRKCAEEGLRSVIGDGISDAYFVGNAPMGHIITRPSETQRTKSPLKKFFFKSQVIAANKFRIEKCEDFVWATKDEVLEYFREQAEYLNKMIIS